MKLSVAIQEALVALICYDADLAGGKMVRNLIDAQYFDVYYKDVVLAAYDYIDRYGVVPGEHTLDLVDQLCALRPDSGDIYRRVFVSLEATKEGVNREYVLSRTRAFVRLQALRQGIAEAVDALQAGDDEAALDIAESKLQASMDKSLELFHAGVEFNNPNEALKFLSSQDEEAFACGIPDLDARHIGPARGRLLIFAAPPGTGKTWFAVHQGKVGLSRGQTVVHISAEQSEEETCQRYVQSVFGLTKREEQVVRYELRTDELGRFIDFADVDLPVPMHLSAPDAETYLRNQFTHMGRRARLCIRSFPMASLTVKQVIAYLDGLEAHKGIIPDRLIVDYPGAFKLNPKYRREELGTIFQELKGLAQSRHFAVIAPSQLNREAEGTARAGRRHLAEDYSQLMTADALLMYNQTADEKSLGLARISVDKFRNEKDSMTVLVSQAYATGQFCLESARMAGDTYWQRVEAERTQGGDV